MALKTRLPGIAIVLGILGLIPFVVTGLGAVGLDPVLMSRAMAVKVLPSLGEEPTLTALDPTQSLHMVTALMAYAAVILSFLGAVHWGLALAVSDATRRATNGRLILGVLPALIAWAALLMDISLPPEAGLGLLTAGFILLTLTEARASRRDLVPSGYMWLRWVLSVLVVGVLGTVLVLRLIDAHAHAAG
jgi:ABC-type uncharacterized transport system permease subunit